MMLTLNDGRSELWQWDTGRKLNVGVECSQVHFSNKIFGRSVDVDVVGGTAIIPDFLLQTDKDLLAWAYVGSPENGYTKISKVFKVNRRNKPSEYVFTPVDQMTMAEISAIAQSVRDDADAGKFNGGPGEPGAPGKSAYQYALDGGYTGTEEEFAEKMASESGAKSWNDLTDRPFYAEQAFEPVVYPDSFCDPITLNPYNEPINLGALAGVEEMLFYKGNVLVSDAENYVGATWLTNTISPESRHDSFSEVDIGMEMPDGARMFSVSTDDLVGDTWSPEFRAMLLVVSKENEYGIPIGVYMYNEPGSTPVIKGTISKLNYVPIPEEYLPDTVVKKNDIHVIELGAPHVVLDGEKAEITIAADYEELKEDLKKEWRISMATIEGISAGFNCEFRGFFSETSNNTYSCAWIRSGYTDSDVPIAFIYFAEIDTIYMKLRTWAKTLTI